MPKAKPAVFTMSAAIPKATGVIIDNNASRLEGICDVILSGHKGQRLVATRGTVKIITNVSTGKVVGKLERPPQCKRFEGQIDGQDVVGLYSGKFQFYIWTKAEAKTLGYDPKPAPSFSDVAKKEAKRVEMLESQRQTA